MKHLSSFAHPLVILYDFIFSVEHIPTYQCSIHSFFLPLCDEQMIQVWNDKMYMTDFIYYHILHCTVKLVFRSQACQTEELYN